MHVVSPEEEKEGYGGKDLQKRIWRERFCWFRGRQSKTNEWVNNKVGVKRELLDTVKARKLAYYGYTMRKRGSWLEKEIMQGTMPRARRR